MQHRWTREEDILIFYIYKYGEEPSIAPEIIRNYMRFSNLNSIKMRTRNFQALDGEGGLRNYSELTESVHNEYRNISQEDHRQECLRILNII
jgi:hypothetical protein